MHKKVDVVTMATKQRPRSWLRWFRQFPLSFLANLQENAKSLLPVELSGGEFLGRFIDPDGYELEVWTYVYWPFPEMAFAVDDRIFVPPGLEEKVCSALSVLSGAKPYPLTSAALSRLFRSEELLLHEAAHCRQQRELGGLRFLWAYFVSGWFLNMFRGLPNPMPEAKILGVIPWYGAYEAIPLEVQARVAERTWDEAFDDV